ncbi:ATP-binding cassette domain-containing protein [Thorsellia kenyensis]|uniref:ATP-binding cassette domain-containing protein n=1 Tax=Thorsellia kenyensis TaxID=1549888 RepID=A0ABV6CAJ3_9GAMM
MLELKNITIKKSMAQDKVLIDDLTMQIKPGEIKALMGASGSGKSTLLNYLLGHLENYFSASGEIELYGRAITHLAPHLRQLGILFQSGMLFPHLSVLDNINYAISQKFTSKEKKAYVLDLLHQVGLSEISQQMPNTLSGGQYIRVALVRTIAANPKGLLLDEPFSRLDANNRFKVRDWLFNYVREKNIPVLLVTHDLEDVEATGHIATYLGNQRG